MAFPLLSRRHFPKEEAALFGRANRFPEPSINRSGNLRQKGAHGIGMTAVTAIADDAPFCNPDRTRWHSGQV